MAPAFDVFLSHNGRDKPAVEHIAERLRRAGMAPWLDKWQLTPGGRWQDELHAGLQDCRAFAYFLGPNGEGDWAREELDAARSRAAKDREFRIFPVLLPGTPDPFDRTTMPPFLGHRTWVDLRGGLDDPAGLQAFINAIKGVPLGAPEGAMPVVGADDTPPYRGLDAFDEADAAFFFGREPDIQQLLERLKGGRFLAVLGPSGSGKSSLVRAGLVPALRRGAMPASDRWLIEVVKPGARPAEAIAARLLAPGAGGAAGMQATLDGLLADARTLHLAGTLALGDDADRRLVWVIDQAEELFTLCHDDAERAAVIDNLTYAASVPGGRAVVVLAMRADFYTRAAAHADLAAHIARSQHLVAPLTPEGIRDAIEEPARAVGLVFEEGLVGTILDDLEGQPGSLPLLQYALLELWKRRRGGMLTLEGYRESGGVQGAIAKRAEAIYAAFTPEEQAIVRRALLRLTQPGEGTEDTRRRASMRELVTRADEQGEVQAVIGELTDARLLTASADPSTGEGLVDISHEALIRAWPRVRQWLDEDRAGQRVLRRITESSAEWARLDRDEGVLFRGARLAEAVEWREEHEALLNDDERAFLDASAALLARERAAKERARRRVTIAAGVLAAVFLVLAGLAGLQWRSAESERRTAEDQRARAEDARRVADDRAAEALEQRRIAEEQRKAAELAQQEADRARVEAQARALGFMATESESELDRALLLALEASELVDAPDIRSLLLRELTREPRLVGFLAEPGPAVTWLDVDKAGARVAWVDEEGAVRVAALADRHRLLLEEHLEAGSQPTVALSEDGAHVVASTGLTVRSWDVATGEQRWETTIVGPQTAVRLTYVAADPPRVAVAGNDASVQLLDADTGRALGTTIEAEVPLDGGMILGSLRLAFSSDGTAFVRGEQDGSISVWTTLEGVRDEGSVPAKPGRTITDFQFSADLSQVWVLFADGLGWFTRGSVEELPVISTGIADGLRVTMVGQASAAGILVASANSGLRYLPMSTVNSFDLTWESVSRRRFPYALDTSGDGLTFVAGYPDGRLAIYDLRARWPLATPIEGLSPLTTTAPWFDQGIAIRRDGRAFASWDVTTGTINVTDDTGASLTTLPTADPATTYVEAFALSDDGRSLLLVEDRQEPDGWIGYLVRVALPGGERSDERRLGPWGYRISLSADGTRLAIGDLGEESTPGEGSALRVVDVATGAEVWRAPDDAARRSIRAVDLSADGRTLRAGALMGSALFGEAVLLTYDLDGDTPAESLTVDADRISAITSSPDRPWVVIAASDDQSAADGTLLVYKSGDTGPSGSLGPPGDNFVGLRFAPDGRLLSGGPRSSWMAWNVDADAWVRQACAIAGRDLTQAEWHEALGDEPWSPTCSEPSPAGPGAPGPTPGGSIAP